MSSSDACDIIYAKKSPGLDSTCWLIIFIYPFFLSV